MFKGDRFVRVSIEYLLKMILHGQTYTNFSIEIFVSFFVEGI